MRLLSIWTLSLPVAMAWVTGGNKEMEDEAREKEGGKGSFRKSVPLVVSAVDNHCGCLMFRCRFRSVFRYKLMFTIFLLALLC